MVAAKQKAIVDSQKINRGESKYTTTENHQFTKVRRKKEGREHGN